MRPPRPTAALAPAKVSRCCVRNRSSPARYLPRKTAPERFDGKQKATRTRAPLRAVWTQASARDHAMDMNMLGQRLAPGVENRRDADFRAQVFGITGKLLQGLGGGLEQQVVEAPLVHANQGIELMG